MTCVCSMHLSFCFFVFLPPLSSCSWLWIAFIRWIVSKYLWLAASLWMPNTKRDDWKVIGLFRFRRLQQIKLFRVNSKRGTDILYPHSPIKKKESFKLCPRAAVSTWTEISKLMHPATPTLNWKREEKNMFCWRKLNFLKKKKKNQRFVVFFCLI